MDDYERTPAEIIVDAHRASAIGLTPLWLVRLNTLPPLPLPPVQEDLDLCVAREIPGQIITEVRLVSRNDEQISNLLPRRRWFERRDFNSHTLPSGASQLFSREGPGQEGRHYAAKLSCKQQTKVENATAAHAYQGGQLGRAEIVKSPDRFRKRSGQPLERVCTAWGFTRENPHAPKKEVMEGTD